MQQVMVFDFPKSTDLVTAVNNFLEDIPRERVISVQYFAFGTTGLPTFCCGITFLKDI